MKRGARQTKGSVAQAGREFSRAVVMGKEGACNEKAEKAVEFVLVQGRRPRCKPAEE